MPVTPSLHMAGLVENTAGRDSPGWASMCTVSSHGSNCGFGCGTRGQWGAVEGKQEVLAQGSCLGSQQELGEGPKACPAAGGLALAGQGPCRRGSQ